MESPVEQHKKLILEKLTDHIISILPEYAILKIHEIEFLKSITTDSGETLDEPVSRYLCDTTYEFYNSWTKTQVTQHKVYAVEVYGYSHKLGIPWEAWTWDLNLLEKWGTNRKTQFQKIAEDWKGRM